MQKQTLYLATLLSVLLIATGCANHKTDFLRTESTFDQKKETLTSFNFDDVNVSGKSLNISLLEKYSVPEYKFDIVDEKYRVVHGPNILNIIMLFNPASYLLALFTGDIDFVYDKHSPPFGRVGPWRSNEEKTNIRATGNTKPRSQRARNSYNVEAAIWLYQNSFDKYLKKGGPSVSKLIITSQISYGSASFDLSEVENFSERPEKIKIDLTATSGSRTINHVLELTGYQLSAMHLSNKEWTRKEYERNLPIDQRKEYYSVELRKKIKEKDYATSIEWFAKLEDLKVKLPESFSYHYGSTLAKIHKTNDAKKKLRQYLSESGQNGRYAEQARRLLNTI